MADAGHNVRGGYAPTPGTNAGCLRSPHLDPALAIHGLSVRIPGCRTQDDSGEVDCGRGCRFCDYFSRGPHHVGSSLGVCSPRVGLSVCAASLCLDGCPPSACRWPPHRPHRPAPADRCRSTRTDSVNERFSAATSSTARAMISARLSLSVHPPVHPSAPSPENAVFPARRTTGTCFPILQA